MERIRISRRNRKSFAMSHLSRRDLLSNRQAIPFLCKMQTTSTYSFTRPTCKMKSSESRRVVTMASTKSPSTASTLSTLTARRLKSSALIRNSSNWESLLGRYAVNWVSRGYLLQLSWLLRLPKATKQNSWSLSLRSYKYAQLIWSSAWSSRFATKLLSKDKIGKCVPTIQLWLLVTTMQHQIDWCLHSPIKSISQSLIWARKTSCIGGCLPLQILVLQ